MRKMMKAEMRWGMILLLMLSLLCIGRPMKISAATKVPKILMDQGTVVVQAGSRCRLIPGDLTGAENIQWSSSKRSVAVVSQKGRVRGKSRGVTIITANADGKIYQCKVKVKQPVTSVTMSQETLTMVEGSTYKLGATVAPENANKQKLAWHSKNKDILQVDSQGEVTAIGVGTGQIVAKAKDGSGQRAVCNVTVTENGTMRLSQSQLTLAVGAKQKLKVTKDDDIAIAWGSSNTSVARVTQKGVVKAKGAGSAVIAARKVDGSMTIYCRVTVTEEEPEPEEPSISAQRLLTILQKYSDQVKEDKANGIRWVYGGGATTSWTTAHNTAVKNGTVYVNCALPPRWSVRELGILDGSNFWGIVGGGIEFRGTSKEQLSVHCDIIPVFKTPNQLLSEGNLLPGDICSYVSYQHTNVYAGDGKWYDAGRGSDGTWINGEFVFNSFGPVACVDMAGTKIGHIIRIVR